MRNFRYTNEIRRVRYYSLSPFAPKYFEVIHVGVVYDPNVFEETNDTRRKTGCQDISCKHIGSRAGAVFVTF